MVKEEVENKRNFIVEGLYYNSKQRDVLKKLITSEYKIINILVDVNYDFAKHLNI